MDPMTMMMIATAASSMLGGMGNKSDSSSQNQQQANPFQQKQAPQLMGFPSMQNDYLSALKKMSRGG